MIETKGLGAGSYPMAPEKDQILTQRIIMKQKEEIERLNDIINELEKDIKDYVSRTEENMKYVDTLYIRAVYNNLANILNKLQELKGDGSNV